jgi:hypothetical protein
MLVYVSSPLFRVTARDSSQPTGYLAGCGDPAREPVNVPECIVFRFFCVDLDQWSLTIGFVMPGRPSHDGSNET